MSSSFIGPKWEKAPGADCQHCPLRFEPYALGDGPDQADLCIVGEAPGYEEAKTGQPFVGRSGRLLDSILQFHKINRQEVYVTNACLCRPADNKTPPPAAVKACRRRLIQELRDRNPKTVLTLGNTASKSLGRTTTGITDLRKQQGLTVPEVGDGVVLIPTFHPAAALRNGDYFPSIISDVKKVHRVQVKWEYTKWELGDVDTLEQQLQSVQRGGLASLDIETHAEDFARKQDAKRTHLLCVGITTRAGTATVYPKEVVDSAEWRATLNKYFELSDIRWAEQNGKFDTQGLWGCDIPAARVDEDTMLLHYSTDERKGTHDLEQIAQETLGAPAYKTDARQYLPRKGASLIHLPLKVLYEYNASDADVTYRLVDPLTKEMESDGTTRAYRELLIPGSNALARVEYLGCKIDRDELHQVGSRLIEQLGGARDELHRWVGNPNSPPQVKRALAELGRAVDSTDKDHLKEIIAGTKRGDELNEFCTKLLDYRGDAKLYSTYVRGLERSLVRGRVHPTFLLHGTATGRLSCRRPNVQNVPSGSSIRDAFVAGPGNVLLNADYSQIEFRLAAYHSGDPWLLQQFREGRDFHHEVAVRLFGPNYTDLQYLRAKAVNFGILYGRGAKSLAEEHGGSIATWQGYINDFFRNAPRLRAYHRELEKQLKEQGWLESYFGRKRRFWLVSKDNWFMVKDAGYNFPLQSTASDFTLLSYIRLEPLLRGKAAAIITVHDNLLFEVREQYLDEVIHTVKTIMEDTPISDVCPTPVDIKVGHRWGDHRNKPCHKAVCDHLQKVA